jgi:hypothetical protein
MVDVVLEAFFKILNQLFPQGWPNELKIIIGIILLLALTYVMLKIIISIIELIWEKFIPLLYNKELNREIDERKSFAKFIWHEIINISRSENWNDDEYSEVESEVEASLYDSIEPTFGLFSHKRGIRREKSLTSAIQRSKRNLIFLVGEPGSGKSVALRHLAEQLAEKVYRSRSLSNRIPLYINLKELSRNKNRQIDHNLIYDYILETVKQKQDPVADRFIKDWFDKGLKKKLWIFLFDSFDEIPEVLNSERSATTIQYYSKAISDFMAFRGNNCKCILASRPFHSPQKNDWEIFRILPLSDKYQKSLIRKLHLPKKLENEVIGTIGMGQDYLSSIVTNPLLLRLLCEHVRLGNPFPKSLHDVFETFINNRLINRADQIREKYGVETQDLRIFSEQIAFCMTQYSAGGLNPRRDDLRRSMKEQGFHTGNDFDKKLNALIYINLARREAEHDPELLKFSFRHRRLQEYFATCLLRRNLNQINPHELLTKDLWRETTVTLLQSQPFQWISPILTEADSLLTSFLLEIDTKENQNIGFTIKDEKILFLRKTMPDNNQNPILPKSFNWPSGCLHLLSILQDGFINRMEEFPDSVIKKCSSIIDAAFRTGLLIDKKWALEVGGVVDSISFETMLIEGIKGVETLKNVVFKQVIRFRKNLPDKIDLHIKKQLIKTVLSGQYNNKRLTTHAYINRLPNPKEYQIFLFCLEWGPLVDLLIHVPLLYVALTIFLENGFVIRPLSAIWIIGYFLENFFIYGWIDIRKNHDLDGRMSLTRLWSFFRLIIVSMMVIYFCFSVNVILQNNGYSFRFERVFFLYIIGLLYIYLFSLFPAFIIFAPMYSSKIGALSFFVAPFVAIFNIFTRLRSTKKWITIPPKNRIIDNLYGVIGFFAYLFIMFLVFGYLFVTFGELLAPFFFLLFSVITSLLSTIVLASLHEIRSRKFIKKNINALVNGEEFLENLSHLFPFGFYLYARGVREKKLLKPTIQNEKILQDFITLVELSLINNEKYYVKTIFTRYFSQPNECDGIISKFVLQFENRHTNGLSQFPWFFVEELNLLLEQLKSRRNEF